VSIRNQSNEAVSRPMRESWQLCSLLCYANTNTIVYSMGVQSCSWGLLSWRVLLQAQLNTHEAANQGLTSHIRNFQAGVSDVNSPGQWPSRTPLYPFWNICILYFSRFSDMALPIPPINSLKTVLQKVYEWRHRRFVHIFYSLWYFHCMQLYTFTTYISYQLH